MCKQQQKAFTLTADDIYRNIGWSIGIGDGEDIMFKVTKAVEKAGSLEELAFFLFLIGYTVDYNYVYDENNEPLYDEEGKKIRDIKERHSTREILYWLKHTQLRKEFVDIDI